MRLSFIITLQQKTTTLTQALKVCVQESNSTRQMRTSIVPSSILMMSLSLRPSMPTVYQTKRTLCGHPTKPLLNWAKQLDI